jgi:hypothetical protein
MAKLNSKKFLMPTYAVNFEMVKGDPKGKLLRINLGTPEKPVRLLVNRNKRSTCNMRYYRNTYNSYLELKTEDLAQQIYDQRQFILNVEKSIGRIFPPIWMVRMWLLNLKAVEEAGITRNLNKGHKMFHAKLVELDRRHFPEKHIRQN